MITLDGVTYATAAEIAHHLGRGVTPDMIRKWARRDGLTTRRRSGRVIYRVDEAELIEIDKRYSTRGRPRSACKPAPGG